MPARLSPVFEMPLGDTVFGADAGYCLARVAEAHPDLAPLLDFCVVDPHALAVELGMVYPYEEDGAEDLAEIDFGPPEWHEPAAGLAALARAAGAVRERPESIAAAIYDPTLTPAAILADLDTLTAALQAALQHETRFHLIQEA